ncbi:hypothetical protein GWI33_007964 [Rhynchophorus ferrugineus]|uniref:Uncharacterized protein n=1 Tax=Rhynchophorus ferrugineus TaxID=354439 RepID=A0A834IDK3_RHYFE|nr:hypothetical protein GWI33_007964 [Rhynchophorus ferrugineus]
MSFIVKPPRLIQLIQRDLVLVILNIEIKAGAIKEISNLQIHFPPSPKETVAGGHLALTAKEAERNLIASAPYPVSRSPRRWRTMEDFLSPRRTGKKGERFYERRLRRFHDGPLFLPSICFLLRGPGRWLGAGRRVGEGEGTRSRGPLFWKLGSSRIM